MSENKSFTIKKTYVKDLSVEVPNGPEAFLSKSPPKINFKVDRNNLKIDQDDYIVSLTSEVNAKNDEITFFVIEATFSGIFEIKNYDDKEVKQILEVSCPNILFPYLRSLLCDASVNAGFLPVLIQPISFAPIKN